MCNAFDASLFYCLFCKTFLAERASGVKACGVKFLWCKSFWGKTVLEKQLLFLVKQAPGFGVQLFVV